MGSISMVLSIIIEILEKLKTFLRLIQIFLWLKMLSTPLMIYFFIIGDKKSDNMMKEKGGDTLH